MKTFFMWCILVNFFFFLQDIRSHSEGNVELAAAKVVNYVKPSPLNTRLFKELCFELNADMNTLLFCTRVGWL